MLKFIAAAAMVIDHVGHSFFPSDINFRIIGRLAMPIFAFMIAEGCRYTKNRLRYLLSVLGVGALCQAVYFVTSGSLYMCIFITFTVSILLIYALDFFKNSVFSQSSIAVKILSGTLFALSVYLAWELNRFVEIDYGFYGCMLPVFACIFNKPKKCDCSYPELLDSHLIRLLSFGFGCFLVAHETNSIQYWSLLSLPLLALYSGKRGKHSFKYFFYIFYPAHLDIIWLVGEFI